MTISVVIPVRNGEDWIRTLRPIRARADGAHPRSDRVDDGSDDGTAAAVIRCSSTDSRVRLLAAARDGVAQARNAGIERRAANGSRSSMPTIAGCRTSYGCRCDF